MEMKKTNGEYPYQVFTLKAAEGFYEGTFLTT